MMDKYIKFSIIEAEPKAFGDYLRNVGEIPDDLEGKDDEGYAVTDVERAYWVSKETFEAEQLYKLTPENTITKEMVDTIVDNWQHTILNDEHNKPKTVVVMARLKNGFVIVESSSCVDPANFDFNIGFDCCVKRIYDKIWELTGFILQSVQYLLKVPDSEIEPLPDSVKNGDVENASV